MSTGRHTVIPRSTVTKMKLKNSRDFKNFHGYRHAFILETLYINPNPEPCCAPNIDKNKMKCGSIECSVCCLGALPMVQHSSSGKGNYVHAMGPLFDAMEEYTPRQKNVIKSRFLPMIDATERDAKRSEWWDTRMFLIGFGTSLVVTILAAINIASFIDGTTRDVLGAVVLAVSSIGTAALGLRERLKFHETALIARRLSCKLQRRGFLFLARAEPYNIENREDCYSNFIAYTEKIKLQADEEQMKLQAERDDTMHHRGATLAGAMIANPGMSRPMPAEDTWRRKPPGTRTRESPERLRVNVVDLDLDGPEGPPPTPF